MLEFGVSVGCLKAVWGCLGDSEYCLEDDSAKSIDKIPMSVILIVVAKGIF